jgi:hypothetical protein
MDQNDHPVSLPDGLLQTFLDQPEYSYGGKTGLVTMTESRLQSFALWLYRAGADYELNAIKQLISKDISVPNRDYLIKRLHEERRPVPVDESEAADAARFRWILRGHGYFMEEEGLCGHSPCSDNEQRQARLEIDRRMQETRD